MSARHPARQARIFSNHRRRRRPRRIDPLVGDRRNAFPAIFLPRYGDGIADGLAGPRDEIETAIAEADDDLTGRKLGVEAHDLAAAVADHIPATPVPQQLCRRRPGREASEQEQGRGDYGCMAHAAYCDVHRRSGILR